jgi:hypothetical protein
MSKAFLTDDKRAEMQELMQAAETGDAARVRGLLADGADVRAARPNGETALIRAASKGYADVVQILLDGGADVNAEREDGFTPLMTAAFFGHEDVVRALLAKGADTKAQTRLGATAAKWAASRGLNGIVELLEEAEAARSQAFAAKRPTKSSSEPVVSVERVPVFGKEAEGKEVEDEEVEPQFVSRGRVEEDEVTLVSTPAVSSDSRTRKPSFVERFKRNLFSQPATAASAALILASVVGVYAAWRGTVSSTPKNQQVAPTVKDANVQPVAPLPPAPAPPVQETQGLVPAPPVEGSDQFTPQPQTMQGAPLTIQAPTGATVQTPNRQLRNGTGATASPDLSIVSDGDARPAAGESSSKREGLEAAREKQTVDAAGKESDARPTIDARRQEVPRRVRGPYDGTQASSPAPPPVYDPAPSATPKKKVIQWP